MDVGKDSSFFTFAKHATTTWEGMRIDNEGSPLPPGPWLLASCFWEVTYRLLPLSLSLEKRAGVRVSGYVLPCSRVLNGCRGWNRYSWIMLNTGYLSCTIE